MRRPSLPILLLTAAATAVPIVAWSGTEAGGPVQAPAPGASPSTAPAASKQLTLLLTGNGHGEIGPCG